MTLPRNDGFIYLSDYQPPAWQVQHVDIVFALDNECTEVVSALTLTPNPAAMANSLHLNGEALTLLEILLDGEPLPAHRYTHDDSGLTIHAIDRACTLTTRVHIAPSKNTRLEGLYTSADLLLTQCEAEGFRRITFFIDRPDVMPTWHITLRADKQRFPILLANGNPESTRDLPSNQRETIWHNPHPTPCYLFAIAAGPLARKHRTITTADQRQLELNVWAAPADIKRCDFALAALERALRWDEQRFGRIYDLDVFNLVAAADFTMGAMENKGLNIFNARYVLADLDTATDEDFIAIESVIGHEYFHNWSGNRVTCRDWFQLSLKEGLTVFRDQEFTADLHSRDLKRISDVRLLRARQFSEDAGALAHPVRPSRYREINNFYTATVYEKGAEIVRMLHSLLGEQAFRRGMDDYFANNDGRAATIDDFLSAHQPHTAHDLAQFARWYDQSGTPHITISDCFDPASGDYAVSVTQHILPSAEQNEKQPLLMPLKFACYRDNALRIDQLPETDAILQDGLLILEKPRHNLRWPALGMRPLPAFNQGFSAPVHVHYHYSPAQLGQLITSESDGFLRWDALQRLAEGIMLDRFEEASQAEQALHTAIAVLLDDDHADPAFIAECLNLPGFDTLAEQTNIIDVDALQRARQVLRDRIADQHHEKLIQHYTQLADASRLGLESRAIAARALRNTCLHYLTAVEGVNSPAAAHFENANTMTERLAGLRAIVHFDLPMADQALADFAKRYQDDALTTDKWLGVCAMQQYPDTVEKIAQLLNSRHWIATNPNRVRAIIGSFARSNPTAFHRVDGAGYQLVAEQIAVLDQINPQVASRLLTAFEMWSRLGGPRRNLAEQALQSLNNRLVSNDSCDTLAKLLT